MIPEFPKFKALELSDRGEVEAITSRFLPYSDFNFVSMYSWDVLGEMAISKLNGNLVVRFTDYMSGQPFFSFLGDGMPNETAEVLFTHAKDLGLSEELKLMPEDSVSGLDREKFIVREDVDHFDYIFEIEKLKLFEGSDYHIKRNEISKFLRHSENVTTAPLMISDPKTKNDVLRLNREWLENKKAKDPFYDIKNELIAIDRFLNMNSESLQAFGVFSNNEMVAYSINEVCSDKCAIGHFYKANKYNGVFSFLMRESAKFLSSFNIKYLNFEQDLGVEGLRRSKNSYHPKKFLKKYLVTKK